MATFIRKRPNLKGQRQKSWQSILNAPNALLPRESALADQRQRSSPTDGLPGEARLTIGIDARAAAEVPAGRGRVVRELLRTLSEREDDGLRYRLYARTPWTEHALDERFQWCSIAAREPSWHLRAARRANRECGVFLSSNSYLTARFLRIPCVPIVYDLVVFDRSMRPNRRSQIIERLTLGPAVRRSARVGRDLAGNRRCAGCPVLQMPHRARSWRPSAWRPR